MPPPAPPLLAVDARMIAMSGIGVYLRQILARLVTARPDWRFDLYGDTKILSAMAWTGRANIRLVPLHKGIYSLSAMAFSSPGAKPDLLWVPHYNVPLLAPCPVVATVHDVIHLALPEVFSSRAQKLYAGLMLGNIRARARGVIFVSEFSRREFHRLVGTPRGRETVIHNGLDEEWFEARRHGDGAPYFIYVGNIKPHKNLGRLLAAFRQVMDVIPHMLVLVGAEAGFITADASVRSLASEIGPRVRFAGKLDDEALRGLVAGANGLVHPALYEGFGLPPLEAMACGCPTAVSRAASLPEVCGDASLYFDPRDTGSMAAAILRLATDSELANSLSAAGRKRAADFHWDKSASLTLAFLEQELQAVRGRNAPQDP